MTEVDQKVTVERSIKATPIWVWIVVGVLFLGAAGGGAATSVETAKADKAQASLETTEDDLAAAQDESDSLESEVSSLESEVSSLEAELADANEQIDVCYEAIDMAYNGFDQIGKALQNILRGGSPQMNLNTAEWQTHAQACQS